MKDSEILFRAYQYVYEMAKSKPYNIQSIAINIFFGKINNNPVNDATYLCGYEEFCKKHPISSAKDFIYKRDYYTTREMYLISPSHYLYYTFNVFKYFFKNFGEKKIDFSTKNIQINYSGMITFEKFAPIKDYSKFNYSYELFQDKKNSFIGDRVLVMDIQDFFKNINTSRLIDKLKERDILKSSTSDINNISNFFKYNHFNSLPQMHYSIASSALSQFFLEDFTKEMDHILAKENCEGTRFVDDMYIRIPKRKRIKTINNMLNKFTYYLWKDGLNLNSTKTKVLDKNKYEKNVELAEDSYSEEQINKRRKYFTERLITNKVDKLLANDAKLLRNFFLKLKELDDKNGIDLTEYHKLVDEFIAIDGEHISKVINNLIYGSKWKSLNIDTLNELIANNNFVFFNPSQFTTFFILIYEHLKLIKKLNDDFLSELINTLKYGDIYTFRESIITIQHFVQSKKLDDELVKKMIVVNKDYIDFLQKYISL